MDFNQIKEKLNSFLGNVSSKSSELVNDATDKAKSASRIAKLTLELNSEKDGLKKSFAALGEAYYENKADAAEGLVAQLCEEIDSAKERIAAIEAEIATLKTEFAPKEADVEVSFEEVVDEAEQEATEEAPAVEEAVEEVKEAVEEVVEEVKEVVEEVVEEVKDEE